MRQPQLSCHELRRSQVVREAVRPRGSSVAPVEAPFRSYSRNGSVLSEQKGEILWGGKPGTVHNPTPRYRRDALQGRRTRKGKMKLQHAAALALVGWYLIRPPVPHLNALDSHTDTAALPSWTVVSTFPTQEECETQRSNPWERCVASDDAHPILPAPGAARGDRPGRSAPYGQP